MPVDRYRDDDGNPCCAKDFKEGQVCPFYQTQRFGANETCLFAEDNGRYRESMKRRKDGNGTLIPLKTCPVWKGEV